MTDTTLPAPLVPAEAATKKRPASQYYWGDWWKDKSLHSCSLTARGLWHEMNCLMHDGEPYGHLTLNGNPMTVAQLANQCRISSAQCSKLLKELDAAGVPSRTSAGVIFSRRMVRDEIARNARAEGGKSGAEHGVKGAQHGAKGGRPTGVKGGSETPLDGRNKPPPSSSSSSSASASPPAEEKARKRAAPPKPPPQPCPDGVDPQVWTDWLELRKAKKAPVTATVIEAAIDEAAKVQLTLGQFLRVWCMRGTQGLQADWIKPAELQRFRQPPQSFTERTTAAKASRVAEMTRGLLGTPQPAAAGGEVIDMEATDGAPRLLA